MSSKLAQFEIFYFRLPLAKPFPTRKVMLKCREGFLIQLITPKGRKAWGEVAPLPGFSLESLTAVKNQLFTVRKKILNGELSFDLKTLEAQTLSASIKFGLEMAFYNLQDALNKKPLQKNKLAVIRLLEGDLDQVRKRALEGMNHGFKFFKLKVGGSSILQEQKKVRELQQLIRNKATLRLDANRQWSFDEAVRFARGLNPSGIEYIEEPFVNGKNDMTLIETFFDKTGFAVALDESLLSMKPGSLKFIRGVRAIVVKPTVIGGLGPAITWVRWAKARRLSAVISSSFETSVGLSTLAQLAAAYRCEPLGIDTLKWLAEDLLKSPLDFSSGILSLKSSWVTEENINWNILEKI